MKRAITTLLLTASTLATAAAETPTVAEKQGYERRTTIAEMADTVWQNQRFSVKRALELLHGMSGSDRYYATRTLLGDNRHRRNLLPNRMTITEMQQLLEESGPQRGAVIQLLSDQGIPAAYLSAQELNALLAPLTPIEYDRTLRALLGSNRMERNYSLPNFTPSEIETLLSRADDRAGLIRYLADRALLAAALSTTDAEQILSQQGSMDRHDSLKALLGSNRLQQGYLQLPLEFDQAQQLLQGVALRSEMVRYFADHAGLSAAEAGTLLQGIRHTDRFNSLRALLGENQQQQNYLQFPLSIEDAAALLDGIAYRDAMVGFMADRQLLTTPLSADQALQLLGTLSRADRHDALRALLGNNEADHNYLALPLSATTATTLLQGASYRDELIQSMADRQQLAQEIELADGVRLLEGLRGDARYQGLRALLGENLPGQRYLTASGNASGWITLLEGSANRLQLLQQIQQQSPFAIDSAETLQRLLGRLYGSEREQASRLLTPQTTSCSN